MECEGGGSHPNSSSEGVMAQPGHKSESGDQVDTPLLSSSASKMNPTLQQQQQQLPQRKKHSSLSMNEPSLRKSHHHHSKRPGSHNSPAFSHRSRQRTHPGLPVGTDPNMERYLDEQYRNWSGGGNNSLPLPSTFNQEPNYDPTQSISTTRPHHPPPQTSSPRDDFEGGHHIHHHLNCDESSTSWMDKFKRSKPSAKTRRVCEKNGDANVSYKNISEKRRRYVSDIYTTLVDSSWSTSLFLFATSFYMTWLIYAVLYYFICYWHGDFEPDHMPDKQEESGWTPCIWEVDGFAAAFLFSLETQHTIGYGSRQTTTACTEAMVIMSTQSVIGCLIQAFMVGLVFAKLSTPNKRAKTVVFSRNAIICERDKKLCLVFRVGDMRSDSFIVGAQISAKLIKRKVTDEGEMFHDVRQINIAPDSSNEPCIFLIWPITIIHVIDEESPFYNMSAPEMASDKFELHVVLEGTIEATSMTFQARTSYLPNEVLWGHRFEPMMIYRRDHNKYQVNFSAFNSTYEVDTPLCSSFALQEHYKKKKAENKSKGQMAPKMLASQSIHGYPIASMASFGRSAMRRYLKNPQQGISEEDCVNNMDPKQQQHIPEIKVQVGSEESSSSISDESDTSEASSSPGSVPTEPQQDHNYH